MNGSILTLAVDGQPRARIDLERECEVRCDIDSGAEVLEVWAEDADGRFLLAALRVPFDPKTGRQRATATSVGLPAGQSLALEVTPKASGEDASASEAEAGA
ncbi:MAG: hypothetical protein AAF560_25420, partial [Acidobacteriota bacterium]